MRDIVIVGGGVSGLFAGYELEKMNLNYAIVYDKLGGRIETANIDDITHDMGAEYFIENDKILIETIRELQLTTEEYISNRAIFNIKDEKSVLLPSTNDNLLTSLLKKISLIRYLGRSEIKNGTKLKKLLPEWEQNIKDLYSIIQSTDLTELYNDVKELTQEYNKLTLEDYLIFECNLSKEFVYKMIDPLFRAIYMCGADKLVATLGVMGFAAKNNKIHHIKGGNQKLIDAILSKINAPYYQDRVEIIEKMDDHYSLKLQSGRELKAKKVFLAIPLYSIKFIDFKNFNDNELIKLGALESIEYNPHVFHHLVEGKLKSNFDKLIKKGADTIFIANPIDVAEINHIRNDLFDITSSKDLETTQFQKYFKEFKMIKTKHWLPSYPLYTPENMECIPKNNIINNTFCAGTDNFITSIGNSMLIGKLVVQYFENIPNEPQKEDIIDLYKS